MALHCLSPMRNLLFIGSSRGNESFQLLMLNNFIIVVFIITAAGSLREMLYRVVLLLLVVLLPSLLLLFVFYSFIYSLFGCGFARRAIFFFIVAYSNIVRHLAATVTAAQRTECQSTRITGFCTAVCSVLIWRFQLNLLHSHNLLQLWTPFAVFHPVQYYLLREKFMSHIAIFLLHSLPGSDRIGSKSTSEDIRITCTLHSCNAFFIAFHTIFTGNIATAHFNALRTPIALIMCGVFFFALFEPNWN